MLCGVATRVFLQFTLTIDFINYFCNFSFDLTCAGGVRKSKKKKEKEMHSRTIVLLLFIPIFSTDSSPYQ